MKKIILFIITLSFIFSSLSNTFAEEWYIERLLDLNYWIEQYDIELSNINYIHFNDEKYNRIYNELKTVDSILKNEFMKKYRSWEYWNYQTNWIIKNYNNFIYYTNKFFYFLKLKEQNPNYKEVDTAIMSSYKNMKSYYNNFKNIVRWN
jgi:hypothetical protein